MCVCVCVCLLGGVGSRRNAEMGQGQASTPQAGSISTPYDKHTPVHQVNIAERRSWTLLWTPGHIQLPDLWLKGGVGPALTPTTTPSVFSPREREGEGGLLDNRALHTRLLLLMVARNMIKILEAEDGG